MAEAKKHLWGEDAEAVETVVAALFGHHPERGGSERDQAAYAVVRALREAGGLDPATKHHEKEKTDG